MYLQDGDAVTVNSLIARCATNQDTTSDPPVISRSHRGSAHPDCLSSPTGPHVHRKSFSKKKKKSIRSRWGRTPTTFLWGRQKSNKINEETLCLPQAICTSFRKRSEKRGQQRAQASPPAWRKDTPAGEEPKECERGLLSSARSHLQCHDLSSS